MVLQANVARIQFDDIHVKLIKRLQRRGNVPMSREGRKHAWQGFSHAFATIKRARTWTFAFKG